MTCPDCERYKKSAAMWRNKAYEASGHPLPWGPGELSQGLSDEEIFNVLHPLVMADLSDEATDYEIARAIEAKLKEKNG